MPKLVPYLPRVVAPTAAQTATQTTTHTATQTAPPQSAKSVHERLGKRASVCESIHTSQLQLYRPRFKAKAKSVQNRLGKNWVNPSAVERNRIAFHALNTFAKSASRNMTANDDVQGQLLLNAFSSAIQREAEKNDKYDMKIQKEISSLQVSLIHVQSNSFKMISILNKIVFSFCRANRCIMDVQAENW